MHCRLISEVPLSALIVNQTHTFTYELNAADREWINSFTGKDDLYFIRARLSSSESNQYLQAFCKAVSTLG